MREEKGINWNIEMNSGTYRQHEHATESHKMCKRERGDDFEKKRMISELHYSFSLSHAVSFNHSQWEMVVSQL
jgi:hypothetical protein